MGRGLMGTTTMLRQAPVQVEKTELASGEGIDIIYYLSNMGPAKFAVSVDRLLEAARWECNRYSDVTYKFAKFVVELYGPSSRRGRVRTRRREIRELGEVGTIIYILIVPNLVYLPLRREHVVFGSK